MDDDQKELLKVAAEKAMEPFANLVEKLFGGAVEQIGGAWEDRFAVRRQIRRIKLFEKLQHAIDEAGFDPRQIPDNIWLPALQEASLQDGDEIHDIWANLLANAADPRQGNPVYPSFILMVKELASREAKFLNALYSLLLEALQSPRGVMGIVEFEDYEIKGAYSHAGLSRQSRIAPLSHGDFEEHGDELREDLKEFEVSLNLIMRLGIIVESVKTEPINLADLASQVQRKMAPSSIKIRSTTKYVFTGLGIQFLVACQKPLRIAL